MRFSNPKYSQRSEITLPKMSVKLPRRIVLLAGMATLAACQPVAAPVVAPPVVIAPPVAAAPSIPLPPLGSAAGLTIPGQDVDGTRISPNKNLGPEETLWHLRSSYNVAALTCKRGNWTVLAPNYNAFLKKHKRRLTTANRAIERKFQQENSGRAGRRARDTHVTSLYNYFSLPPVKTQFCSMMLEVSNELAALPSSEIQAYSQTTMPKVDAIFTGFYDSYEAYQRDLADWQIKYGN